MVPLGQPSHIYLRVDRDSDIQRFYDIIRNRPQDLPLNSFNALFNQLSFFLDEQHWQDPDTRRWCKLCRRCGQSAGQYTAQLWESHPCGPLKVTLLIQDGGRQPRVASAAAALQKLRERAYRLRTVSAFLLYDLVSEHVIELALQHYTHVPNLDVIWLLDNRLISMGALHAAPRREENIRAALEDLEEDM